jgi:phospho-N-acetylmuramoyl-pentapeptide-transferase
VIPALKRFKASQTILHYVKEHMGKQGIPTMGGIIFIAAIVISYFVYASALNKLSGVALAIMFSYGVVGFLDDFIKIRYKRNLGLRAYQKIIFQLLISFIASFFVYYSGITTLSVPFSAAETDLKLWIVPLSMFVFLATSNCVNLTDGIDGLAGGTSFICFIALALLIYKKADLLDLSGLIMQSEEYKNLFLLSVSGAGAMLGYLHFNSYPAKVFMGDTGSLALGGLIASLAIFSGYSLFIPVIGIMFVVSGLSVIAQVFSFQVFRKRVFLMAPYHHHLQQKGMHEAKITMLYMTITLIMSLFALCFCF